VRARFSRKAFRVTERGKDRKGKTGRNARKLNDDTCAKRRPGVVESKREGRRIISHKKRGKKRGGPEGEACVSVQNWWAEGKFTKGPSGEQWNPAGLVVCCGAVKTVGAKGSGNLEASRLRGDSVRNLIHNTIGKQRCGGEGVIRSVRGLEKGVRKERPPRQV